MVTSNSKGFYLIMNGVFMFSRDQNKKILEKLGVVTKNREIQVIRVSTSKIKMRIVIDLKPQVTYISEP